MDKDNELVTVKKVDEPTLRITRKALAEHIKLGWAHVESVPEKVVRAVTEDDDAFDGKAVDKEPTKLTLKK